MSRIEIISCDGCGREVEDGAPVSTIAVQDTQGEDGWFTLDLCSAKCVLGALGYTQDEEQGEDEQISRVVDDLPPRLAEEVERRLVLQPAVVEDVEDDAPPPLTMDDRMNNEKLFKAQAGEISRSMFPVRNKSTGER